MAINSTNRRSDYIGDGIADVFNYNFKIFEAEDLLVIQIDDDGNASQLILDTHYSVQNVGYNTGSITLLSGPLPEDYELIILGNREAIQNSNVRNRGSFYPNDHETFFDHAIMLIQQILERLSRVITLPYWIEADEFDPTLPSNIAAGGEDKYLGIKDDGSGFEIKLGPGGGGGLPQESGSVYSILEATGLEDPATRWTDPIVYQGYSERYSQLVDLEGLKETIDYIMDMGYAPPTVSLGTSPSYTTVREKGDTISSVDLTANIVKVLDDISEVRFYRGVTLIDTQVSGGGIPNGGNSTFTDSNAFSDNRSYSVQVDDDSAESKPSATSTRNFVFVYPYYYGVGAAGLGAGVSALTKQIITEVTSAVRTMSPNGSQKMYFAYPASYGALTSILDINSFNTIADWTRTTEAITGLDGNPVNYYVYEFNNFAVAGSYQYTFIQ